MKLLNGKVEVIKAETVLSLSTLRVVRFTERHRKYDGSMSEEFTWSLSQRKSGVAVVIHYVETDEVLLVEQFRPATILPPFLEPNQKFEGHGRTLELVAGGLGKETPEDCATRESVEEAGVTLTNLTKISEFFLSPGVTNEKIFLFYSRVLTKENAKQNGGLAEENEDTKVHWIKVDDVEKMIETGEICDAKTIVGLQWVQLYR